MCRPVRTTFHPAAPTTAGRDTWHRCGEALVRIFVGKCRVFFCLEESKCIKNTSKAPTPTVRAFRASALLYPLEKHYAVLKSLHQNVGKRDFFRVKFSVFESSVLQESEWYSAAAVKGRNGGSWMHGGEMNTRPEEEKSARGRKCGYFCYSIEVTGLKKVSDARSSTLKG